MATAKSHADFLAMEAYIARIKNKRKQAYAKAYLAYQLGWWTVAQYEACERPSAMAAQGVRMQIDSHLVDGL